MDHRQCCRHLRHAAKIWEIQRRKRELRSIFQALRSAIFSFLQYVPAFIVFLVLGAHAEASTSPVSRGWFIYDQSVGVCFPTWGRPYSIDIFFVGHPSADAACLASHVYDSPGYPYAGVVPLLPPQEIFVFEPPIGSSTSITEVIGFGPTDSCTFVGWDGSRTDGTCVTNPLFCPPGYSQSGNSCAATGADPNKNKGPCPSCEGNPINPLVGNKYQVERDYTGSGPFPLVVERIYNSSGMAPGAVMGYVQANPTFLWTQFNPVVGTQASWAIVGMYTNTPIDNSWRLNYDRTLTSISGATTTATLYRSDSKTRSFTLTGGVWVADAGEMITVLTQQVDGSGNTLGWTYVNENDETERYDPNGKLLSISNRAGLTQTLQYNAANALSSVTDAFGRQLKFTYTTAGLLNVITDPNGGNYTYTFDGHGNLSTVSYPDSHTRQYAYENTAYPAGLTGILDENGNRFATWSYDAIGRTITSEHATGIEKVTVAYPSATTSIATDAGGATRTYSSQLVNGIAKAGSVAESWSGGTRTLSMSYDTNGNVSSRTDYNGNVTNYSYDLTRDLETSRTEAAGTAQARTITTQWHPTYRLPLVITEPGRTTTYTYDANGNQLTKTIAAGNASRTWTYTYNGNGQILSATGPRSDVADLTTYTYDASGNLSAVKNALGQVTTLSNYDANGRVGLITDPNGATTALTYAPRGWLTSKTVTAGSIVQSTAYAYDNAGQLTMVTLPDNSTVSYTYDPAHRLTNVKDSLGNSITYTLDPMDNRIGETVTDPTGTLTRQISRIFDAVNRLQQVTGAAQ